MMALYSVRKWEENIIKIKIKNAVTTKITAQVWLNIQLKALAYFFSSFSRILGMSLTMASTAFSFSSPLRKA